MCVLHGWSVPPSTPAAKITWNCPRRHCICCLWFVSSGRGFAVGFFWTNARAHTNVSAQDTHTHTHLAVRAAQSTPGFEHRAMAPKVRPRAAPVAKGKAKAKAKAGAMARPFVALPVGAPVQSAVFSCDAGHTQCIINCMDGQAHVNINGAAVRHGVIHCICRYRWPD